MYKRFIITALALLLPTVCLAASAKFGYVDFGKVIKQSDAGAEAVEKLKEKAKRYEEDLVKRKAELGKMQEEFNSKQGVMNDTAKEEKVRSFNQKVTELERLDADYRRELDAENNKLTRGIAEEAEKVIQEYGKKNDFTLIFDRGMGGIIYGDNSIDLTDAVLKVFNDSRKRK